MRKQLLLSVLVMAAGCGGDSSGPDLPDVAGTYHGQLTLDATSSVGSQRLAQEGVTVTLDQSGDEVTIGVVSASGTGLTSTGTIVAGGAMDLNEPDISAFIAALPQCAFNAAHATNGASVIGNHLTMTGTILGAFCPWVESGGDLVQTTFEMRIEATK